MSAESVSNQPNTNMNSQESPVQSPINEKANKSTKKRLINKPILTEIDTSTHNSQIDNYKLKDSFIKGFGPSHFQSSGTLQNSIASISIPKATRFPRDHLFVADSDVFKSNKNLSTLSQRAAMIGYGSKVCYPSYTLKMARDNPAPNNYMVKSDFDIKNKGKSFGLPFSVYAKVKLPHIDILTPENAGSIPGPGYYNILNDSFGKYKKKALLLGKGKTMNDMIKEKAPPPNYYTPKSDLVINNRYKNMTFGISQRNTFQENLRTTPGPGTYNMKSKFDLIVERNRFFKGYHDDESLTMK